MSTPNLELAAARKAFLDRMPRFFKAAGITITGQQAYIAGMKGSNYNSVLRGERAMPHAAWERLKAKVFVLAEYPPGHPHTPEKDAELARYNESRQAFFDMYEAQRGRRGRPQGPRQMHPFHEALPKILDMLDQGEAADDVDGAKWALSDVREALVALKDHIGLYKH